MSIWYRLGEIVARCTSKAINGLVETVRTLFASDPELRRRVAFSVAMIALSAKMAKADGVVTQDEIRAFRQVFHIPEAEARNVARLYDLAKRDIAGFEIYAAQLAGLCSGEDRNCPMLEDVLDGLFHIAKADGTVHEREVDFLRRVSEIFRIDGLRFEGLMARHVHRGAADPYVVLGVGRSAPFAEIKARYRALLQQHHPDRLIARGVPQEFIAIANDRMAAINVAFATIEKAQAPVPA